MTLSTDIYIFVLMKYKFLYIKMPETEYVKLKVFTATRRSTLQKITRRAVNFYIEYVKQNQELEDDKE